MAVRGYFKYGKCDFPLPDIREVWDVTKFGYAMLSFDPESCAAKLTVSAFGFHRWTANSRLVVTDKNYLGSSMNATQMLDSTKQGGHWSCAKTNEDWGKYTSYPFGYPLGNDGSLIIWANHDIINKDDGTIFFANNSTEIEAVLASAPLFVENLPLFGEYVYEQGAAADALSIVAESPDGGTLTYQWYRSGVDVAPLIEGATGTSCTPATDVVCTRFYRCMVTNTIRGGLVAFGSSNSVKVTTIAAGSGGGSGGGIGGGGSGDIEITEKAKSLQGAFMAGLSAGISMYRGTVLIGDTGTAAAAVASESGATIEEIQTAFRSGFASGVAMYGLAIDRNPVFAEQGGETMTVQGAYSVVQNGKVLEVT